MATDLATLISSLGQQVTQTGFSSTFGGSTGFPVGTANAGNASLAVVNTIGQYLSGIAGALGKQPSSTTQWLSVIPVVGGIASGISALIDDKQSQPFNLFASLALATDQLRRGIPWNDPRLQERLANFNKRAAGTRVANLVAANVPEGARAEWLLAAYDWKQVQGQIRPLPIGTVVSAAQRAALGVPTVQQAVATFPQLQRPAQSPEALQVAQQLATLNAAQSAGSVSTRDANRARRQLERQYRRATRASAGTVPASVTTPQLTPQEMAFVRLIALLQRAQALGYAT